MDQDGVLQITDKYYLAATYMLGILMSEGQGHIGTIIPTLLADNATISIKAKGKPALK